MLKTLFSYRRYIIVNAISEVRTRYAGTTLGVAWNIVHPLTVVLVLSAVLSGLSPRNPGSGLEMAIFISTGLIPWLGFADSISRGVTSLVENASFLRKLPIPEEVYVAKSICSSMIYFAILLVLLIALALFGGRRPGPIWLLVIPVALLSSLLAFGLTLALSAANVFARDIGHAVPVFLQIGLWAAPILYPPEVAPQIILWTQHINPFMPFLTAFRDLLLDSQIPGLTTWGVMGGWTAGALALGTIVMNRLRGDLRDLL